jgi:cytochrome P450
VNAPINPRPYHELDVSSDEFWNRSFEDRDTTFAALRESQTLTWHEPLSSPWPHEEQGFWAATRHADIAYVSKNHALFSSAQGAGLGPMPAEMQRPIAFFLMMDPPEHTRYRQLIGSAFTPKAVAQIQSIIEANAKEIVDDLVGAGEFDFVERCSALLPMRTVADMIGVPKSEREAVRKAAHRAFTGPMPEDGDVDAPTFMGEQLMVLRGTAIDLANDRRKNPQDDLMTNIVQAEIDGHRLTDEEIGAFMWLLSTAGNDTTKQTTSICIWALSQNPDQLKWLMEDFDGRINTAVEEFVRYASPVLDFGRVATEDTQIGDVVVKEGEKVGLFYCSGNRDESVFQNAAALDLSRFPNLHQGFGGGGIHYCLGNQIARTQLKLIFREVLTRLPNLEVLGEPEWLRGNSFVNGIEHMTVRV